MIDDETMQQNTFETWPLAALAVTGGAIDATTWLATNVFAANMTGNAVIAATTLALGAWPNIARYALALGAFFAGVLIGALFAARARTAAARSGAAQNALWFEVLLLVGLAYLLTRTNDIANQRLVLGLAASALGLQTAATHAIFGSISTAYQSGTLAAIARSFAARIVPSSSGFDGRAPLVWGVYVVAAFGAALLIAHAPHARSLIPLVCAVLVTVVGIALSAREDALALEASAGYGENVATK